MLPTNFEFLADSETELRPVILQVGEWVRKHPDWRFLDPRILAKDLRGIDPFELALTLNELVSTGYFRRVYKVVDPSGALTDAEYEEIRHIPAWVRDGFNHSFSIDDGEIVPVFKPVN